MNRTLHNALIGTVARGAFIALPAVALGAAGGLGSELPRHRRLERTEAYVSGRFG